MSNTGYTKKGRRAVDVLMSVLLLFLMAYQVTGETVHEWLGISITVLVIVHNILNRRWYGALFKGRYRPARILQTAVNILLLASIALTALSGMSMSGHAVPFMYGLLKMSAARPLHLAMSHWTFVLMGLHLGMHIPVMLTAAGASDKTKKVMMAAFAVAGAVGLWVFFRRDFPAYMFFNAAFVFLDYEKAAVLVLLENLLMLIFWAFAGWQIYELIKGSPAGDKNAGRHR